MNGMAEIIKIRKPRRKVAPQDRHITVIHPSRNRPELCRQVAEKWLTSAKNPGRVLYVVSVDSDDPMLPAYGMALKKIEGVNVTVNPNASAVQAINATAAILSESYADTDIIVVVSDDFDCPFHWDDALRTHLGKATDFVAKTDDGLQPWIITLPILDLGYYRRFNYIYNPSYVHMFCDTEMTHVADLLDRKLTLPIKFPHNHYSTGKNKKDRVSEKNDNTWVQGETTYISRMAENFGLTDPPGELRADAAHLQWIANKTKQWQA